MTEFDDIQQDSSRNHKWGRVPAAPFDKCLKCGRAARTILVDIAELIPEIDGQRLTTGILDTFWPCISDDEALVKDILE